MLACDFYTPSDAELIPTGEIRAVAGTPFDFRQRAHDPQRRGARPTTPISSLARPRGPDGLAWIATLRSPKNGLTLELHSTEPGVQVYDAAKLELPRSRPRRRALRRARRSLHGAAGLPGFAQPPPFHRLRAADRRGISSRQRVPVPVTARRPGGEPGRSHRGLGVEREGREFSNQIVPFGLSIAALKNSLKPAISSPVGRASPSAKAIVSRMPAIGSLSRYVALIGRLDPISRRSHRGRRLQALSHGFAPRLPGGRALWRQAYVGSNGGFAGAVKPKSDSSKARPCRSTRAAGTRPTRSSAKSAIDGNYLKFRANFDLTRAAGRRFPERYNLEL